MTHPRSSSFLVCLVSLLLATAVSAAPASAPSPLRSVFYRVEARVHGFLLKAEVVGGGRLLMRSGGPEAPGQLTLLRPEEDPWKLYWVKPRLGHEESKHAAVVILPEVSWEALDEVTRRMEKLGRTRARERPASDFDGSFTYVVLGPAEGRFTVRLPLSSADRGVVVANRLTDRWLPGDFDRYVKAWASPAAGTRARAPQGYWFWNQGEREPFDWEPHTYHAFAEALRLLGDPSPFQAQPRAAGGEVTRSIPGLGDRLVRILETLFPKAAGRLPGGGAVRVRFQQSTGPEGTIELQGRDVGAPDGNGSAPSLTYRRKIELRSGHPLPTGDRIEAELSSPSGWLRVVVGYETPGH